MANQHCFLGFLLILAVSSAVMAAYTPPFDGLWKDVRGASTSSIFIDVGTFAVLEYNKQIGAQLVYAGVLGGQIWLTRMLSSSTYQLLVLAKTSTNLYKVYKCVVSMVNTPTMPKTLKSFETVLP